MKALLLALCIATVVVADGFDQFRQFSLWAEKHHKSYESDDQRLIRFSIWKRSVDRIAKRNANSSAVFGLNKFSDLTTEEFRSSVLMRETVTPHHNAAISVNRPPIARAAPAQFDWRTQSKMPITPVKDQGQCGSCWAFSVAETAESAYILSGAANASTLRVSEQQIVDCDQSDDGCSGGNPETAWQYIISAGGLDSEASYPYTAEDGTCHFNAKNVVTKVKSWKYATTSGDETTLQNNLLVEPLSICVDAANWQDYTSGVMSAWDCAWIVQLDHCVQLVGYASDSSNTPYWIVRNSWGPDWGINGYIWLERGQNTCGLTEEATMPGV